MPAPRLLFVVLLSGCAAWDAPSSSSNVPPPDGGATPSHYAPPPPPAANGTPTPAGDGEVRVTIASVRLSEDCPDANRTVEADAKREVSEAERSDSDRPWCVQSTVQLVVDSAVAGRFSVESARVLDARGKGQVGTTRLRRPTAWTASNTYAPWDEQVAAGRVSRVSYALGEPVWAPGAAQPFVLELEVSLDGRRQTVRSPEFTREPSEMVET